MAGRGQGRDPAPTGDTGQARGVWPYGRVVKVRSEGRPHLGLVLWDPPRPQDSKTCLAALLAGRDGRDC